MTADVTIKYQLAYDIIEQAKKLTVMGLGHVRFIPDLNSEVERVRGKKDAKKHTTTGA